MTMRFLRRPLPLLLLLPSIGAAQSATTLLERAARLDVQNVAIDEALRALQRTSTVSLAYSPDLLPPGRRVSCACRDVTVRIALETVLAGTGLEFVATSRQVLIGRQGELPAEGVTSLAGVVVEAGTARPLSGADVELDGGSRRALTGNDGRFSFRNVEPGRHRLRVAMMGYLPASVDIDPVAAASAPRIELDRAPIPLAAVIIAPGRLSVLESAPGAMGSAVTRDDIEAIPQFGDDAFRTLQRMPGVAVDDISTRLAVRGGNERDMMIRLDGVELFEPYHLKDIDGVLGIVDVQSLGEIDLISGGFPAEFGGATSGIFDMRTRRPPPGGRRTTIGMSLSSLSAGSQGSFAGDRGQWLVSLRRGFLDIVLAIAGTSDDLSPRYWDVLARTQYALGDNHVIALGSLLAGDELKWNDDNGGSLNTSWTNGYAWTTWKAAFADRLRAETVLSAGVLDRDRAGFVRDPNDGVFTPLAADLEDRASFTFAALRQAWQLDVTQDLLLKAGFEARTSQGEYDYHATATRHALDSSNRLIVRTDTTAVAPNPSGSTFGAWLAARIRPLPALSVEAGLRFDRQDYTGDEHLGPRLLARWDIDARTSIKASLGRYVQHQDVHELNVADGETAFSHAERADQLALGIERAFGDRCAARIEAYLRHTDQPLPSWVNLSRQINPILEVESDRTRLAPAEARAMGLELFLARDGTALSWSASYALASTEDRIDGRWAPRTLDQRHTLNLMAAWRLGTAWQLSGAWQFHTGWPLTEQFLDLTFARDSAGATVNVIRREFGPLNQIRLPDYHRLDLRVTRNFQFVRSRLEVYFDVFNVLDRINLRGFDYFLTGQGGRLTTARDPGEELLPRLPTLGFRWVF